MPGADLISVENLPAAVRALYPFEPKSFDLGAGSMSYLDEGPRNAPAVLMVHGNPTWSFYYRGLVDHLRDRFRCIVPDHLGCGLSAKPTHYDYHLGAHIENLGRLLDHLDIDRAHLIVHDWGGPIGLGAARRRNNFIDRLVILNTGAFPSTNIPKRIAICRLPWIGALLVRGLNGFSGAAVRMTTVKPLPAAVAEGYLFPHRSWSERIAVHRFVRDIPLGPGHRTQPEIEAIAGSLVSLRSRPVKIIWGVQDWCFDQAFLGEFRRRLPEAAVTTLPEAGHWLLEDEGERVAHEVSDFLE